VSPTPSASPSELHNLHDLGGIDTPRGPVRPGRLFRSANPDALSPTGWRELHSYGIRTVVDLRNDYEVAATTSRPLEVTVVRRPIEDQSDGEFMAVWGDRLGTPEYYPEVLRLWPALVSDAIGAIADAPPGGVLMHCMAGRDRTGMIAAMILELLGVRRDQIAQNYARSARDIDAWWRIHGGPKGSMTDSELDAYVDAAAALLNDFLDEFPVRDYVLDAGVTPDQLARLRSRLLDD
jgi:protein-tyrosine phosphatase